MTDSLLLKQFIKKCESDFMCFCGIDTFPPYNVVSKEMTLDKSKKEGFDSVASAFYDVSTGAHRLEMWSKLYLPQMNAEYLVFHELTHILDAETYSQKDKCKNVANKGYTEYHAAQNDFMQLLGAKNITEPFSFSMKQRFETFSREESAFDFLMQPHNHAISMIERDDFPASIEALAVTLGLIFNYYGRRSVCKMYATDYVDNADNSVIAGFIREDTVKALDMFMLDWFTKERVSMIDSLYYKMVISLAQQYHLS